MQTITWMHEYERCEFIQRDGRFQYELLFGVSHGNFAFRVCTGNSARPSFIPQITTHSELENYIVY